MRAFNLQSTVGMRVRASNYVFRAAVLVATLTSLLAALFSAFSVEKLYSTRVLSLYSPAQGSAESANSTSQHGAAASRLPQSTASRRKIPLLSTLVDQNRTKVIGNASFLVDFAIVGNMKTATTFLHSWLRAQPSISMHEDELKFLSRESNPAKMVEHLYQLHEETPSWRARPAKVLYGYKAPRDIVSAQAMDWIDEYWPTAKLIVGMRHPVSWFESLYNFRAAQLLVRVANGARNRTMPPAERIIGPCMGDLSPSEALLRLSELGQPDLGICTDLARFHVHLNLLGKTNTSDLRETALLGSGVRVPMATRAPLHHSVFVYEARQLNSGSHFEQMRQDLTRYLGIEELLGPPPPPESAGTNSNPRRKYPLDVCRPEYAALRHVLVQHAINASTWIREYFMDHPEVVVSSPDHFRELLLDWHRDPCAADAIS